MRNRGIERLCASCVRSGMKNEWAVKHGCSATSLYKVWASMKQRCLQPNSQSYPQYGGRGITLCSEWRQFVPFRDWALANGYEKGLVLDRKDNELGYFPDNCRWATTIESGLNRTTTKSKVADVAVMKELLAFGLSVGFVAALYGKDSRRVSDLKNGKKFGWVTPFVEMS